MESRNIQLNKLFDEWEATYPVHKGIFVKDGIINEGLFNVSKKKILFLCKEANQKGESKAGDFRAWWEGRWEVSDNFSASVSEWAWGILENFPPYDTLTNKQAKSFYLNSVAFMNIKKLEEQQLLIRMRSSAILLSIEILFYDKLKS